MVDVSNLESMYILPLPCFIREKFGIAHVASIRSCDSQFT